MRTLGTFAGAIWIGTLHPVWAAERVVCTLAIEAGTEHPLIRDGDCDQRISPASTFKIAISLMGFDSGVLTSSVEPAWPFEEGYPDWNPIWRQTTTPQSWMRDSVVWFSQRTTRTIGTERFTSYVKAFEYGNQDVSGDKGKANGLTHAWLSSSLQISPNEQVEFLNRMLNGELSVQAKAVANTKAILALGEEPHGWRVYGKTGAGMPFDADGNLLRGQPFGWYVGWAEKGERKVVFARLLRFTDRPDIAPGIIARQGLIDTLFAADGSALDE